MSQALGFHIELFKAVSETLVITISAEKTGIE